MRQDKHVSRALGVGSLNRPRPSPAFPPLSFLWFLYSLVIFFAMPASNPVNNTLGALLIGTILSSIIYGVTLLQVYSYYNSHCSRDWWPLKPLVVFLIYTFSKASLS
ncbi:hypothetical protein V8E53_009385, partial [Lactarius tabidus]